MVEWSRRMETGVRRVDTQHREMVEKINGLQDAISGGHGQETLCGMVDFLCEYAIKHFNTEETLMCMHAYPGYDEHRREHETFRKEFGGLAERVRSGERSDELTRELQAKLSDWLIKHIMTMDREMGRHLVMKGVA